MSSETKAMLAMGDVLRPHLEAASSKFSRQALAAFTEAEEAVVTVAAAVALADEAVQLASAKVHAADEVQDRLVLELATSLSGDGFERINPFKEFGALAPSDFIKQGDAKEASALLQLVGNVARHPGASSGSKTLALLAREAALKTQEADAQRTLALAKRAIEFKKRDDAEEKWSSALADLRTTIAYADYVEGTSHYETVFGAIRMMKRRKKIADEPEAREEREATT